MIGNAVDLNTVSGLQEILNIVGKVAGLTKIPKPNFDNIIKEIKDLEEMYSYYLIIQNAVNDILTLFPGFTPVFQGQMPLDQLLMLQDLPKHEVDSIHRQLSHLNQEDLLIYQTSDFKIVRRGQSTETLINLTLNITQKYLDEVAGKITLAKNCSRLFGNL